MTSNQPFKQEPDPLCRQARSDATSGSRNAASAMPAQHSAMAFDSLRTTNDAVDLRLKRLESCLGPAIIGVSTDITERKHAQEATGRRSAVIDSSSDAIFAKTLDGTIISWDRGPEDLDDHSADQVIGHHAGMLTPNASKDDLTDAPCRVAPGENVERPETTHRRKEGGFIDISFTVPPVYGQDDAIVGCSAIPADITAPADARRALKHQVAHDTLTALQGKDMFVTACVGLVVADPDAGHDQLLQDAEVALYRAKERGQSRMELFDDELRDRSSLTLQSSTALQGALEHGELRVFYQPIVDVGDGRPLAVEALLRWQHPERGLVSADEFIHLAEDTEMIRPIGSWVLREALRERAGWEAELPEQAPLRLAVNLSARQLSEPGLVDDIAATLRDHGTDPSSLILEVTESVLMHDPGSLSTLNAIHDLGITLHVDDFGTGYSSLAYLNTLPVDALKIDRAFVDGLATNADDRAIVTAVHALARAFTLNIVAEGVETQQQLSILQELGCDFAQGFLFSRPLPYDEFLTWLRTRERRTPRQRLPQRPATPTVSPMNPPKSLDTIRALCHDLRQPLAVILLLAGADGGDVRHRLGGILDQARWLSDMVENVIGGAADDPATSIDVVDLAARCAMRAQPIARCEIECIGIERAMALVAPVALSRAVSCVLDNAVRAAGPGGHVTVEVNGTDSEVTIQVIDDGPGLGKVPTNNSLGLTITRALVCACGGAFDLRPGPARGVIARIVLPAMSKAILP
jgi:PAS domain S-box-containing protein